MPRNSLWFTLQFSAIVVMVVGCSSPPPVEPEIFKTNRHHYHDYYLAAPATPLPDFPRELLSGLHYRKSIDLELHIGKNGKIRKILPEHSKIHRKWEIITSTIKQIVFYPGRKGNRNVNQKLHVRLELAREKYQQRLITPVDRLGKVIDGDLYWKSMELNKIKLPTIERFPSYFLSPDPGDSAEELNYLLARLDLDNSGRITDYEILHSDAGQYTAQIMAAANWAEFNIPQTNDTLGESVFLRIALYDIVQNPTIIQYFPIDSLSLLERERIKLLPDTVGLMFKPIPSHYQDDGIYSLLGGHTVPGDSLIVKISIGANGRITRFNLMGALKTQERNYQKLAMWFKFFPALDFSGKAQPFSGIISVKNQTSTMVRIKFLWLDNEEVELLP